MPTRGQDERRNWVRLVGEYTGLALTLPACGVVGYFIGAAVDEHWHTEPVFTLICLFLGAAAALVEIVRVTSRMGRGSP